MLHVVRACASRLHSYYSLHRQTTWCAGLLTSTSSHSYPALLFPAVQECGRAGTANADGKADVDAAAVSRTPGWLCPDD